MKVNTRRWIKAGMLSCSIMLSNNVYAQNPTGMAVSGPSFRLEQTMDATNFSEAAATEEAKNLALGEVLQRLANGEVKCPPPSQPTVNETPVRENWRVCLEIPGLFKDASGELQWGGVLCVGSWDFEVSCE
ncbi:MAG: hypothetical protein KDD66_02920 [Bdellovibrionales bacterium]|nr:hypothetical protein [Bdellovibrionales bacterium]